MPILQTEVLPIEYDDKTKKIALKTKAWLDTNPSFFKEFLPSTDKISYIDKKSPLYIGMKESILEHLDGITAKEAIKILKDTSQTTIKDKILILMYLWNERINGKYDYSSLDYTIVEKAAMGIYYCDAKNYQGYHDYLKKPCEKQKSQAFYWFQEKYRFPLLDYMIQNQLEVLKKYYLHGNQEEILQELSEMISTTLVATTWQTEELKEKEIVYPLSKNQAKYLVEEFLREIDPTLTWLNEFYTLEKSNRIIDNITDSRLDRKHKCLTSWHLFYAGEKEWCIYAPWRNTLEDPISLVHEFCHYITCKDETALNKTVFPLSEFSSLFFENLMCEFLKKKGYPAAEVDKYINNRILEIVEYGLDIEACLEYVKLKEEGNEITPALKMALTKNLEQEYREYDSTFSFTKHYQKPLEKIIEEDVDEDIEGLLLMPDILLESYPYIIGKIYSDIMLSREQKDSTVIPKMISITERICNMSKEEVLQELNLTPQIEKGVCKKKSQTPLNNKKELK